MKQLLIRKGNIIVEEVPAPAVEEGTVLVEVAYSCISTGTEIATLASSSEPLWKKALKQPDKAKSIARMAQRKGVSNTVSTVRSRAYAARRAGYSCSGVVIDVGGNIADIRVGERVACAGAGYANHAEIVNVPRNLLVKVPEAVSLGLASTTTLGALALHGVRRASPTLGETVVVLGLGILGQLSAQLLRANGCRAIGIDIDAERIELAKSLGLEMGIYPAEDPIQKVFQFTEGLGADAVVVSAAARSNEVISQAFQMCRKKGRVVLIGDVGLHIKRSDIYAKELDFFVSTSYGPGRYESNYEEKGLDYPIGYVRWTENRNMAEYLRLLKQGRIQVAPLISEEYPLDRAKEAYRELSESIKKPLMVLLKYTSGEEEKGQKRARRIDLQARPSKGSGRSKVAIVGPGSFAQEVHLPNIMKLDKEFSIHAVVSRKGDTAKSIAQRYQAAYAATDYHEIIADEAVDAVLICTRHNLHAGMVIEALRAGKHVFVEKPLCLNEAELKEVISVYNEAQDTHNLKLMVGFNRRFSPHVQRIKEIIDGRINPMIINYRMNVGYIPLNHWVHTEEGGGRNIGEACHVYDLFNFLAGAESESIVAKSINPRTEQYGRNDNFIATIGYSDGSVCNLVYCALGTREVAKEQMEIYVDGKIISLDDYEKLEIRGARIKGLETRIQEKGHSEELIRFAQSVKGASDNPIPLWQLIQATEISFEVEKQICAE
jgi:predicted dehydrogenase/threonine dehydrogenase-like Zn-dependent dehydrogenase